MNFEKLQPIILYLLILAVSFYFVFYIPQKRKKTTIEEMQNKIKIGDKVVTVGGIVGIVNSIDKDIIILEVSKKNDHIQIIRSAIQQIVK